MRREGTIHAVVCALAATMAAIALGTLPALATAPTGPSGVASPTPTAGISPSSSPMPSPSAEPSPLPSAVAKISPSAAPPYRSSGNEESDDPGSREPAGHAGRAERTPRQAAASAFVAIRDNRFVPGSITVEVGTTVIWRNAGQNPHTVTANDRAFDSGTLESGGSFRFTFEDAGTVAYYCQIHGEPGSGMTGTVVVVAAAEDAAGEGDASSAPDVLARTGRGVVPLALLALGMAVAGALAVRVGSAREGR